MGRCAQTRLSILKSVFSCFGHNCLLRTPILMILDSMEILWKSLQGYIEVHVIRSIFGHQFNRCCYFMWTFNQFIIYLSSFFDSCFVWVLYSSLGPNMIHSINFVSLMIMLSIDHQNHLKWPKWGHVRYKAWTFNFRFELFLSWTCNS